MSLLKRCITILGMAVAMTITASAATVTVLNETFEGTFPSGNGWSVGDANSTGTPAYWGKVSSVIGTGGTPDGSGNKGWCAGIGGAGTVSAPRHQDNMSAYMSKAINLTGASAASLNFRLNIPSIEANIDAFRVYINSTMIYERKSTTTGWTLVTLSLNNYVGSTPTLKFEFYSDSSVVNEGAYLDLIQVTKESAATVDLAMRNLSVTRASTTARAFTACSFDIYNYGPSLSSGTILVEYYLSDDTTFGDADDRKIGDTSFSGVSIANGETRPFSLSSTGLSNMSRDWTAGLVPNGNYYVWAKVTCSTATETDPGDNYNRTSSTFLYSTGVEGIVSVADIVPTSWTVIGPANISGRLDITLRNRDNPTALQKVVVGLRDSAGNWVSGAEPAVVLTDVPESDADGEFYDNVSFTIPTKAVTSAQSWQVWVGDTYTVTDTQAKDAFKARVATANDNMNRLLGTVSVNPSPATVDLAMRNLSVTRPSDTAARTFTACSFDIYNYGPSLSSGTLLVEYYLSSDTTFGNADDRKIGDTSFSGESIAAGVTRSFSLSATGLSNMVRDWTSGLVPYGNYYVIAKVTCSTATETDPSDNYNRTSSTFLYSTGVEGIVSVADIVPTLWTVIGPANISGRFDITLRNRDNPTALQKVVVGIRDSAGNWVSGTEPAVVLTDVPESDADGEFYDNVSFTIPTKSVTSPQTWQVWIGDTYTVTDTQAKDAFKARSATANDNMNRLLGTVTVNPSSIVTVTFSAQGGTVSPTSITGTPGQQVTLPMPTRTGYTFGGWWTGPNGTGSQASSPYTLPSSSLTIYAKWTAITYTVTYNGNGSTGGSTANSSHTYDASRALNANGYTRTGHSFAGWATSSVGSAAYSDGQSVVNLASAQGAVVTLYAKWSESSSRQITVAPVAASVNADITIPILIDNANGVLGFSVTLNYPASLADYVSVAAGSLTAGWSIVPNGTTDGRVVIAGAGTTALSGSGSLCVVRLHTSATAGSGTMSLNPVQLNDGGIPCEGSFGISFTTMDQFLWGNVNGDTVVGTLDASEILKSVASLPSTIITRNPPNPPAGDVDGNGVIGTIDASYILQKVAGIIPATGFPADTNHDTFGPESGPTILPVSSMQVVPMSLARQVTVNPVSPAANADIDIPILIDNASGVLGFAVTLNYPASLADYVSVVAGSLTTGWSIVPNGTTDGRVVIAGAGTVALSGSGSLCVVRLRTAATTGSGTLSLNPVELNDGGIAAEGSSSVAWGTALQPVQFAVYGQTAGLIITNHPEFVESYRINNWNGAAFDANVTRFTASEIDVICVGGDTAFSSATALAIEAAVRDGGKILLVNFWSNRNFGDALPGTNGGSAGEGTTMTVVDPASPIFAGLPTVYNRQHGTSFNRELITPKAGSTVLMKYADQSPALLYWRYGKGWVVQWASEQMGGFFTGSQLDTINHRLLTLLLTTDTGAVTVQGNAMWNRHAYFSWRNITHVYQPDSNNAVIDTWKTDDNGNGDPRDDDNRILWNGRTDTANGIALGFWDGGLHAAESGWDVTAYVDGSGNGVVEFTRENASGSAVATYTLSPDSGDLHGEVSYQTVGAGTFYWGLNQINNVWVSNNPGEMSLYDQAYLNGNTLTALGTPRTQEPVEGEDFLSVGSARRGTAAIISSAKGWTSVFGLTSATQDMLLRSEVGMSSSFGGWAFSRSAGVSSTLGAGGAITARAVFSAESPTAPMEGWRYPRNDRIGHASWEQPPTSPTGNTLSLLRTIPNVGSVLTADVDGDGVLDIVTSHGSTVRVYGGQGNLKRTINLPRNGFLAMLEDANGDGVADIFVGSNGPGFAAYVYKGDGTLLKTFIGQHGGGVDEWMRPIAVSGGKILMGYNAGWAVTPRGVAAFDYASATEQWYYQIGPANGLYSVADMDGDGKLDITMNSHTVHNGASGNGTTDGDMYLVVVDENGTGKLSQMYAAPSNGGASHLFADLNEGGSLELLGFKGHDASNYPGQSKIHVFASNGTVLHTFNGPQNNDWYGNNWAGAYAVGDLDNDGQLEVVATASPSKTTYVLSSTLAKRAEANLGAEVRLIGDLNGDGFKEIVLLSATGVLTITDRNLNVLSTLQVGATGGDVIVSDVTGDGKIELLCRTDALYILTLNAGHAATAGVAFDLELPDAFASAAGVSVTGLPAGLRYNATTRQIAGVPTVAGTFTVTVSASGVAPQTFTITVRPLPAWAQGVFNGVVWVGDAGCAGIASMSVTAAGKVSGKLSFEGASYSFSAPSYTARDSEDEHNIITLEAVAKARGKPDLPLTFDLWRCNSSCDGDGCGLPEALGGAYGWCDTDGGYLEVLLYRDVWKEPGMAAALAPYVGYYTAALPGDGMCGSGYLAFTVDAKGRVKTAGKLADGTRISLSGALVFDDEGSVWTVLHSAPKAYQGGAFSGVAEFVIPEEGARPVVRLLWWGEELPFIWESRNPQATGDYGAGFYREIGLSGGWYDKLANLYDYYQNGLFVDGVAAPELAVSVRYTDWNEAGTRKVSWSETEWIEGADGASPNGLVLAVTPATGVGTGFAAPRADTPLKLPDGSYDYGVDPNGDGQSNTAGLTFRFTRATGLFSGSFKAWYDYVSAYDVTTDRETLKHLSKTVKFEGVLTPYRDGGDAAGSGFFLWGGKNAYDTGRVDRNGNPVMKTYKYNDSYDLLLMAE